MIRNILKYDLRGHTLIEAMLTLTIFTFLVVGIGGMLNFGFASGRDIEDKQIAMQQAQTWMMQINALPYSGSQATAPTAGEIEQFFLDGTVASNLNFRRLAMWIEWIETGSMTLSVSMLEHDMTIQITSDINADGDDDDENEGTPQLYRVEVFYNGNSLLRTYRAAPPQFYYSGAGTQ